MSDHTFWNEIDAGSELRVMKLHPDATVPTKANVTDLGLDLYALENTVVEASIPSQGTLPTKVRTGIACAFPFGYGALIRDRSSVATKKGIFVIAGVIDEGYRGEILVAFQNVNRLPVEFTKGEKIAQLILVMTPDYMPIEVQSFDDTTERGENGFGSSGK